MEILRTDQELLNQQVEKVKEITNLEGQQRRERETTDLKTTIIVLKLPVDEVVAEVEVTEKIIK